MVGFSPVIGKIFGIPLQLHWTFVLLLIFSLISPALFAYIVLLFAFVTIHEIAHSVTAKRNGIGVKRIVLYPLGGGSLIDMNKVTPELEFRISIVGPLSNIFMGGILGIIVIFLPSGYIHSFVQLLFLVNILLGALNIIPAFPLDGGRILRSFLQSRYKRFRDQSDATFLVSKISSAFAFGSFALAIISLFLSGPSESYRFLLSFSFLIVAFYIYAGNKAELYSSYANKLADRVKIGDILSKDYALVEGSDPVSELHKYAKDGVLKPVLYKNSGKYFMVSKVQISLSQKRSSAPKISDFGTEIPALSHNPSVKDILNAIWLEQAPGAVVLKGASIRGLVTRQHLEYVLALHSSQKL